MIENQIQETSVVDNHTKNGEKCSPTHFVVGVHHLTAAIDLVIAIKFHELFKFFQNIHI
jgi:hypothetical protein